MGKEPVCNPGNTGDVGLISALGRSPGGGYGNPLKYSCLANLMDRGAQQPEAHSPQGSKESDMTGARKHTRRHILGLMRPRRMESILIQFPSK